MRTEMSFILPVGEINCLKLSLNIVLIEIVQLLTNPMMKSQNVQTFMFENGQLLQNRLKKRGANTSNDR